MYELIPHFLEAIRMATLFIPEAQANEQKG